MVSRTAAKAAIHKKVRGPNRGSLLFFVDSQSDSQLNQWEISDTDGEEAIAVYVQLKAAKDGNVSLDTDPGGQQPVTSFALRTGLVVVLLLLTSVQIKSSKQKCAALVQQLARWQRWLECSAELGPFPLMLAVFIFSFWPMLGQKLEGYVYRRLQAVGMILDVGLQGLLPGSVCSGIVHIVYVCAAVLAASAAHWVLLATLIMTVRLLLPILWKLGG